MSETPIRWIQGSNYAGNSQLVHAVADDPAQRKIMALGRLGIYTTTACQQPISRHSSYFLLAHSDEDAPTYTSDGWLEQSNQAGLNWNADLRTPWVCRCYACERAMRKIEAA